MVSHRKFCPPLSVGRVCWWLNSVEPHRKASTILSGLHFDSITNRTRGVSSGWRASTHLYSYQVHQIDPLRMVKPRTYRDRMHIHCNSVHIVGARLDDHHNSYPMPERRKGVVLHVRVASLFPSQWIDCGVCVYVQILINYYILYINISYFCASIGMDIVVLHFVHRRFERVLIVYICMSLCLFIHPIHTNAHNAPTHSTSLLVAHHMILAFAMKTASSVLEISLDGG